MPEELKIIIIKAKENVGQAKLYKIQQQVKT